MQKLVTIDTKYDLMGGDGYVIHEIGDIRPLIEKEGYRIVSFSTVVHGDNKYTIVVLLEK